MPGNLNKIWDAVKGNVGPAWRAARATGGYSEVRGILKSTGLAGKSAMETRRTVSMASRAMAGGLIGAGIGAAWGAVSDRESIVGGAMKGAFVGAASRVALRGFNPKFSRGLNRFTQSRNMRDNLKYAWNTMSSTKNQKMRNWVVGMGLFGAARGMMSGDDNPIGGAVGGTVAGGVQGAALYGGYRGIKAMKFKL